ncbi:DUF4446 family protein [Paenibacillus chibensis]|uniref:DUF4446 family protein n=1 Tax=Paenibacillus chibensis TaxID=59846 RepID=A0ABU6PVV8_9BACL|nr:DUF4446 family protein [Paenibacillus chibensis]MEC0373520.1 DUF4446 family protein [Paenibacillus chibensis]MED5018200.1 DUF4446 family protein [Paenibacillus chibensis]
MSDLNSLIMEQLQWFVGGVILLILILLVMVLTQGAKLRKMRRKYDLMMEGSGVENLETLLIDLKVQMDSIEDEQEQQRQSLGVLLAKLQQVKGQIGMKRYNAFSDQGSDLSFSLAIVDEKKNGVVISALYSRDSSYVYAKPLAAGESKYALSPEEVEAINLALQQG